MPGKSGDGQVDREYLKQEVRKEGYKNSFYEAFKKLGPEYFIEIAGVLKYVNDFHTADTLKDFILTDNWRYYYFTIGRDYKLGVDEMKEENIVSTVLSDFSLFYPLYRMIKDTSVDMR